MWKVIAADMPLGLVVPDGATDFEAVAQGDPGAPLGRELQIAELLRFIKHRKVTGTLWLTADVHYTSAQHYAPERAAFKDFAPFWEFVSGPLAAGDFRPTRWTAPSDPTGSSSGRRTGPMCRRWSRLSSSERSRSTATALS